MAVLKFSLPSLKNVTRFARTSFLSALAYFLTAFAGSYLIFPFDAVPSSAWPAMGVAAALSIRFNLPSVIGILIGATAFNLDKLPYKAAMILGLCTALSAFVYGAVLKAFKSSKLDLSSVSGVAIFTLLETPTACAIHAVSSMSILFLLNLASIENAPQVLWTWWFNDMLAVYLITPVLLSIKFPIKLPYYMKERAEGIAIILGMFLFTWLALQNSNELAPADVVIFVLSPFVLLAAFRFLSNGVSIAIFVASTVAYLVILYLHQLHQADQAHNIFTIQVSMIPMSLTGLFVAAAFTERHQAEAKLNTLANHDPLTGLPNRSYFQHFLMRSLAYAQRQQYQVYLLFIDLDRFKKINDSQGHELGDIVLQIVGTRLNDMLRADDFVARLGGDEFAIIFIHPPISHAANNLARRINNAISQPLEIHGRRYTIGASIGISVYPNDAMDANTLLRQADMAMYQSKQKQTKFEYFSPDMNAEAHEQLIVENGIRQALENDELLLYYQPKIDLKSNLVVGLEALVRWQSADTLISPYKFIPIAEETGLIIPIGRFVIRRACEQWVSWNKEGLNPPAIAINLSLKQFNDPNLLNDITTILNETGIEPSMLHVEITESATMIDSAKTLQTLEAMRALNLHLYIDDFGTGHSNLGQLRRLPIDAVKIDKSFVNDILINTDDAEIVTAIIRLAHTLNLKVIAEGIEHREQMNFLKEQQCDEMQGYLISKPLPANEVTSFFNRKLFFY